MEGTRNEAAGRPVPSWAEVRACAGHLRRRRMLRRAAVRAQVAGKSADRFLLWVVLPRVLPWAPALMLGLVAFGFGGQVRTAPAVTVILPLLFVGMALGMVGERCRRLTDFERLHMPSAGGVLAARWLRHAPWVTACGVAWVLGAWWSPSAVQLTVGGVLGALAAPWFVVVSAGSHPPGRLPTWSWSLFRLLGLLLAVAVVISTLDPRRVLGDFQDLAPQYQVLGLSVLLFGMTLLAASLSLLGLPVAMREARSGLERTSSAQSAGRVAGGRAWPSQHLPPRSRARGDLGVSLAGLRAALHQISNPVVRVVLVVLSGARWPVWLWNIGVGVWVVLMAAEQSEGLPRFLPLLGLLLVRPYGRGPDEHRWMLGCDYREQVRAETWLLLTTAWLPRAAGALGTVAVFALQGDVRLQRPLAAALLVLAIGLPVVGLHARHAWAPWRAAPWWLKIALVVGMVSLPFVAGGLSLQVGLVLGAAAGVLGAGWTTWSLLGLPERRLADLHRRESI